MESDESLKRLEIKIGFAKFVLSLITTGIFAAILNHQLQNRELEIEEKNLQRDYLSKFINEALDDNLEKRVRFAHYFSSLLGEGWSKYHTDLVKQFEIQTAILSAVENELKEATKHKDDNREKIELLTQKIVEINADIKPKEVISVQYKNARVSNLISTIAYESKKYDLPPTLMLAIIEIESGFNLKAVSLVGARGLFQIMPATGRHIASKVLSGKEFQSDDLFNPDINISLGANYFKSLVDKFDYIPDRNAQIYTAILSLNASPHRVKRWLEDVDVSSLNAENYFSNVEIPFKETHRYLEKVVEAWGSYSALYEIK